MKEETTRDAEDAVAEVEGAKTKVEAADRPQKLQMQTESRNQAEEAICKSHRTTMPGRSHI